MPIHCTKCLRYDCDRVNCLKTLSRELKKLTEAIELLKINNDTAKESARLAKTVALQAYNRATLVANKTGISVPAQPLQSLLDNNPEVKEFYDDKQALTARDPMSTPSTSGLNKHEEWTRTVTLVKPVSSPGFASTRPFFKVHSVRSSEPSTSSQVTEPIPAPHAESQAVISSDLSKLESPREREPSDSSSCKSWGHESSPSDTDDNPSLGTPAQSKQDITRQHPIEPEPKVAKISSTPAQELPMVISNDTRTFSHPHETNGSLDVTVLHEGQELGFKPTFKGTGAALYRNVRNRLGLAPDVKLNLVLVNHTMISEDNKPLWNHGIRHFPTIVTSLPQKVTRGDRLQLSFKETGPNVNGPFRPPVSEANNRTR